MRAADARKFRIQVALSVASFNADLSQENLRPVLFTA